MVSIGSAPEVLSGLWQIDGQRSVNATKNNGVALDGAALVVANRKGLQARRQAWRWPAPPLRCASAFQVMGCHSARCARAGLVLTRSAIE